MNSCPSVAIKDPWVRFFGLKAEGILTYRIGSQRGVQPKRVGDSRGIGNWFGRKQTGVDVLRCHEDGHYQAANQNRPDHTPDLHLPAVKDDLHIPNIAELPILSSETVGLGGAR